MKHLLKCLFSVCMYHGIFHCIISTLKVVVTYMQCQKRHYVFPMNQKCSALQCEGLWFCHWLFELCVSKQVFRDPILNCWNGSNKWFVCHIIAEYGFVSVKLCLLPSLLFAACGRMDKITLCSAGQRGDLWASALLPANTGPKLQPQSFQALCSQPVSFPFSEQW